MAADSASHFAIGVELTTVETTISAMWAQIPARLLEILRKNAVRPAVFRVRNRWMEQLLGPVCDDLGIKVELTRWLPALQELQQAMEGHLSGR